MGTCQSFGRKIDASLSKRLSFVWLDGRRMIVSPELVSTRPLIHVVQLVTADSLADLLAMVKEFPFLRPLEDWGPVDSVGGTPKALLRAVPVQRRENNTQPDLAGEITRAVHDRRRNAHIVITDIDQLEGECLWKPVRGRSSLEADLQARGRHFGLPSLGQHRGEKKSRSHRCDSHPVPLFHA